MNDALTQQSPYVLGPKLRDYAPPDWRSLVVELHLSRKAKVARRRLLRDDFAPLDAAENDIDNRLRKEFDELVAHCTARQEHCVQRAKDITASTDGFKPEMERIRDEGKVEMSGSGAKASLRLGRLLDDETAARRDLATFQDRHKRVLGADYPGSRSLHVVILLITIFVETMLNAYFFKEGGELGWVEGVIKALLVSVANVMFAFVFGGMLLLRQMHHVDFSHRLAAYSLFVPFVATIVGFNLLIAHYRAQLERDPVVAMSAAWTSWLEHPTQLGNVSATVLLILGVIAAAIACLDALFIDDPYPGYGRIDRRYREANAEVDEELTEVGRTLTGIGDQVAKRIDERREELVKDFRFREAYGQELAQIDRDFTQRKRHLLELRRTTLLRFRDQVRTGLPGPDARVPERLWAFLRRVLRMRPYVMPPQALLRDGVADRLTSQPSWADSELAGIAPAEAPFGRAEAMKVCNDAVIVVRADVQSITQMLQKYVLEGRGTRPSAAHRS